MFSLIPKKSEYDLMKRQAEDFLKSGFLPPSIDRPEKVLWIMQLSRELNIPPAQAINQINVIHGKPTTSPQLMLALIERSGLLKNLKIEIGDNQCVVEMTRKGRDTHREVFSMDDARRMGLAGKDNWRKQPKVMLKWRAVSACARIVFSDVIMGLYSPEEINPDIHVSENGEIIQGDFVETTRQVSEKINHQETENRVLENRQKSLENSGEKEVENQPENTPENDPKITQILPQNKGKIVEARLIQMVDKYELGKKWLNSKLSSRNLTFETMEKSDFEALKNDWENLDKNSIKKEIRIHEDQWKFPWMKLQEKGFKKDEADSWLREKYQEFEKESTKELSLQEFEWVLADIEKLPKKEAQEPPEELPKTQKIERTSLNSPIFGELKSVMDYVEKNQKVGMKEKAFLRKAIDSILPKDQVEGSLEALKGKVDVELFLDIGKGLLKREKA